MSIAQALYTGVTGLAVNSDGMNVIANNIANANAKGFKKDRVKFEDILANSLSANKQIGRGSRVASVTTMFTPGGLKVTDNVTDIAIEGQGFLMLKNTKSAVQEAGGRFYTRVGSLQFDRDGYLADGEGGRVQGYMADNRGALSTRLGDIRIETNNIRPSATQEVMLNVNLDSRAKTMEDVDFNVELPDETSNFSNTVAIFDSSGQPHQMTTFYQRIPDDEGFSWRWFSTIDSSELAEPGDSKLTVIANGSLKFDNVGKLVEEQMEDAEVSFNNGSLKNQKLNFDFGQSIEEGGKGVNATTSIAADSATVFHKQDGYQSGNLKTLKIDLDGVIRGVFTNGIEKNLAAIGLATFENNVGLQKAGKNQFFETINSGPAKVGLPQTSTRGSIYSSFLEESNVDIAEEFVNMIMTQRGFQANSRSVTVTDTMIEEVINMKR